MGLGYPRVENDKVKPALNDNLGYSAASGQFLDRETGGDERIEQLTAEKRVLCGHEDAEVFRRHYISGKRVPSSAGRHAIAVRLSGIYMCG
jgi:hypothetical protein